MINLERFFNPRSVAVIGASPKKEKLGNCLVRNLISERSEESRFREQSERVLIKGTAPEGDSPRKIYPVNPNYKKILGLTCFPSVSEVKGDIDLAIIAVKAEIVPMMVEECGKKSIPFVIIISAGFKEIGKEGAKREEKIKEIAKKYKIKILGPNCLGLLDSSTNLNASFASEMILKGEIAFISQSGAICSSMLDWAKKEHIGFSKFISLGNETVLTENDFLAYLAQDKKTKAILMYLEAITDGPRFIKLARQITKNKPIVILKAGKTAKGQKAIASHTGSLAPENRVFEAACLQSKVINVDSLRELFNFTKIFNAGIFKSLARLAVVTNGGGPSIIMSDLIELSPTLELAEIKKETKNKLRKILPSFASVNNPVDILGDALSSRYEEVLKILIVEKNIDGLIVIVTPQKMTEIEKTAQVIIKYHKKKPIIPIFIGEETTGKGEEILKANKVGNFEYPTDVKEILEKMSFKKKIPVPLSGIPVVKQGLLRGAAGQEKRLVLDFNKTLSLLRKYKIEVVPSFFVKQQKDLNKIFKKIKLPVALKVVSPQIIHKTDVGGVKLNLKTVKEARKAWQEIVRKFKIQNLKFKIQGMLIQPMMKGKEIIIGMKRDPFFGPVIVFGLGGIFVEILKDVSMRIAPLTKKDASEMLTEIKGIEILKGARGEKSVNFKALQKIILSLSRLSLRHKEIKEIDLNPVMVNEKEARVVDARIILKN